MAKAEKKATETQTGPSEKQLTVPIGSFVRYTGKRVTEHSGLTGEVIGYRGPTTGLWVKFSDGSKGSISLTQAEIVSKVQKSKKASSSATRKAPKKVAQAIAGASEPAEQAEPESA